MPGRLDGKVAFITGAARGQGRSHAVRMAQEGADIIAVDICRQIESNPYPLSTPEDLAETERLVKELGRRVVAHQADVRERSELKEALDAGLIALGHVDIVVANAGILPMALGDPQAMDFVDATDVDLVLSATCFAFGTFDGYSGRVEISADITDYVFIHRGLDDLIILHPWRVWAEPAVILGQCISIRVVK